MRNYYPLRRIVRRVPFPPESTTTYKELLECGHLTHPRQDIYGETNATRRRCWKCYRGYPIDMEIEAPQ